MAYSAEVRELTFKVWYACGLNDSETSRLMESEHDYVITRQTIGEWKDRYSWEERATRMDLAKQEAADTVLSFEEELLQSLVRQKQRYDTYFEGLEGGTVDTQAMYAYTQLCKQMLDLHARVQPKGKTSKGGLKADAVDRIKKEILGID